MYFEHNKKNYKGIIKNIQVQKLFKKNCYIISIVSYNNK